jgi:hypothetical protein
MNVERKDLLKEKQSCYCGQDMIALLLTLIDRIGGILSKHISVLKRTLYASYDYNFIY